MQSPSVSEPVEQMFRMLGAVTGHRIVFLPASQGTAPGRFCWPVAAEDGDLRGELHVDCEDDSIIETHSRLYSQLSRLIAHDLELRDRNLSLEQRFRLVDRQNAELAALNRALSEMAYRDPLTRLYQRWYLLEQIQLEISRAARYGKTFSVIFIDIDGLGTLNESRGIKAGDAVLIRVARIVEQCCRTSDIIARFAGDEIGILLTDTPADGAVLLAGRILERWLDEGSTNSQTATTVSIAVATSQNGDSEPFTDPDQLLESLSLTMQRAKKAGGSRVEICEEMVPPR